MAYTCGAYRLSAMMNTIVAEGEGEGEDVGTARRILYILIRWGISLRPLWQTASVLYYFTLYVGTCRKDFFHAGSVNFR